MNKKYTIPKLIQFIEKIKFANNFDNINNEIKRKEISNNLYKLIIFENILKDEGYLRKEVRK